MRGIVIGGRVPRAVYYIALVNRLSAGGNDGIQLEQSRGIRENLALANAVAKGLANALAAL